MDPRRGLLPLPVSRRVRRRLRLRAPQQWIAEVTATRVTAEAQLRDSHTAPDGLTPEQVRELFEQAGGLVDALHRSDPALRAQLYEELGIDGLYNPNSHTVHIQAELGRRLGRVGGGT